MTTSALTSTYQVYQTLYNRILNYVPVGPALPAGKALGPSGALKGGLWVVRPADACPTPFAIITLMSGTASGFDHGAYRNFSLEVQVVTRPPTLWAIQRLEQITDQIEAALTDYAEPTTPLKIRAIRSRRTLPTTAQEADRDVVREIFYADGYYWPAWIMQETGTS